MILYAKQTSINEHIFRYEDFPHIFAWRNSGKSEWLSEAYITAKYIGAEVLKHYANGTSSQRSEIAQFMHDTFPMLCDMSLKSQYISIWVEALQFYTQYKLTKEDYTCIVLSAYLGYSVRWVHVDEALWVVMATANISDEYKRYLSSEYFSSGTMWVLHSNTEVPQSANDIDGMHIYCHSKSLPAIQAELAEHANYAGGEPLSCVLYTDPFVDFEPATIKAKETQIFGS